MSDVPDASMSSSAGGREPRPFGSRAALVAFWTTTAAAVAFAGLWVYQSSFVASDGRRYFCLFDDAMVSMRYADNLVHGRGLVWNPGERVEGFTNPLLVFLMAGALALFGKVHAVLSVQVLGVLLLGLDLFLVGRITRRITGASNLGDILAVSAVLVVAFFYPLLYWLVMGMETGLVTTFVLLAVDASLRTGAHDSARGRDGVMIGLWAGLAALARPDSLLFVGIFFLFRMLQQVRDPRSARTLALEVGVCLLPIAAYVAFRRLYYGHWVPNSFVLKVGGLPLGDRVANGLAFFKPGLPFLVGLLVPVVVALGSRAVSAGRRGERWRDLMRQRPGVLLQLALVGIGYGAYQIFVGGDAWPPLWRYTVPATVLTIIAAAAALDELRLVLRIPGSLAAGLALAVSALGVTHLAGLYRADVVRQRPFTSARNADHVNIALALQELTTETALIAPFWAGTIPFFTGRPALDPLGKMDPHVASRHVVTDAALAWGGMHSVPGHNKLDLDYTLRSRRPAYIQYSAEACSLGGANLAAWCKANYLLVTRDSVRLMLLKGSPDVHWAKVSSMPR